MARTSSMPVRMPSPVVARSRKMMCPDCSPPRTASSRSIASNTWRSPTGVRTSLPPAARTARSRPPLLITVTTRTLLRSVPAASRASAQIPMTASPSTSCPRSSTAIRRSASPSNARPRSSPAADTVSARRSGWVEPQPSLMFVPSGDAKRTVTSAPSERNSSGATWLAEPLAQSIPIRSPANASPAISSQVALVRGEGSAVVAAPVRAPRSAGGRSAPGRRGAPRARPPRPGSPCGRR